MTKTFLIIGALCGALTGCSDHFSGVVTGKYITTDGDFHSWHYYHVETKGGVYDVSEDAFVQLQIGGAYTVDGDNVKVLSQASGDTR